MKKFLVMLMVFGVLLLSGCVSTDDSTGGSNGGDSNTPNNDSSQGNNEVVVLVDNENVKISFIELYEEPSLPGNAYLRLKVENKTDKTVMVSLKESYVNDTAQMMGTGVPIVLAPGKSSQQPFFFGYGNLGITSKDEIAKIEFKVWLMDNDNFDTVVETDSLVVDFNK